MPKFTCNLENFGVQLKKLRKQKNLNQSDILPDIKGGKSFISRWESGVYYPGLDNFVKLCYLLDATPNELLQVVEDPDREPANFVKIDKGSEDYAFLALLASLPADAKEYVITTLLREAKHNKSAQGVE